MIYTVTVCTKDRTEVFYSSPNFIAPANNEYVRTNLMSPSLRVIKVVFMGWNDVVSFWIEDMTE